MSAIQIVLEHDELNRIVKYAKMHKDEKIILQVSSSGLFEKIEVGAITDKKLSSDFIDISSKTRIESALVWVATNLSKLLGDKTDE